MIYLVATTVFMAVLGTTLLVTPAIRRWALRRDWVDKPDGRRKLHAAPIPSLGGLGIVAGFLVGMGLLYLGATWDLLPWEPPSPLFWLGGVLILGTGVYDDIRGMASRHKLLFQVLVAGVLFWGGCRIDVAWLPFAATHPALEQSLSLILTLVWIVAVMNAINLIDGLDGLAAGVAVIAFAYMGLIFSFHGGLGIVLPALVMVAALAGFLVYNFNPARIFMGDSGSLFIGFMLAFYSLEGQAHLDPMMSFLTLVAVMGLPFLDTSYSIVRRFLNGQAIFAPDNDHIHHRMVRRWHQRQAVLLLYAAATIFGTIAVCMSIATPANGFLLFGLALSLAFIGLNRLKKYRLNYEAPVLKPPVPVDGPRAVGDGDGAAQEHGKPVVPVPEVATTEA